MDRINTAIVGFGFSGATFHAPVMKSVKNLHITTVVSSNPEKVLSALPEVDVRPSIEDVISNNDIELVVITTPNEFHFPMAKKALEAGKHVVLEKPFAVNVSECETLIDVAEENGCILSVYHNRRFDNDFLTIKKLVDENTLGEVYTYEAHYDRYRAEVRDRWREQDKKGSGILFDLGSHLIDQALSLFGEPDSVIADVVAQREGAKTDDYFHLILKYGVKRVILHGGSLVQKPGPRYQIHGMEGSFVKWGIDPQEEALKNGQIPGGPGWGEDSKRDYGMLTSGNEERKVPTVPGSYQEYYEGIVRSIKEGDAAPVTAQEALNVIKCIELALKSSATNRTIEWK
ncbi:oxidoreductase [Guptibacillus algicola]|uniref:oxidoreductase n=1 Tax=Guptibacillus algicola TaxID=225844 RepID=UPI001CD39F90|nr:oxidoreductase [Alkalihalobacillus algicola]MCA0988943.1 oxidoreductase [Alkalihalobacillus algicola]